jgi:hypothetical protein
MLNQNYIKYIFVLLVTAYFSDQINQFYRFNLLNYKSFVSGNIQRLIETVLQASISLFSIYILLYFNIQSIFLRFLLILFSVFYFVDSIASFFLLIYGDNKIVHMVNEQIFIAEFFTTKICTLSLFYILFKTLF